MKSWGFSFGTRTDRKIQCAIPEYGCFVIKPPWVDESALFLVFLTVCVSGSVKLCLLVLCHVGRVDGVYGGGIVGIRILCVAKGRGFIEG